MMSGDGLLLGGDGVLVSGGDGVLVLGKGKGLGRVAIKSSNKSLPLPRAALLGNVLKADHSDGISGCLGGAYGGDLGAAALLPGRMAELDGGDRASLLARGLNSVAKLDEGTGAGLLWRGLA